MLEMIPSEYDRLLTLGFNGADATVALQRICIWKPGLDRVEEVAPEYTSPSLDYGLSETIDTGELIRLRRRLRAR